jgi:hypothetical protein
MDARAAAHATKEAFVTVTVTLAEALAMFRQFVKAEEQINDREVTSVDMLAKSIKMADVWLNGLDTPETGMRGGNEGHTGAGAASTSDETATERRKVSWRSVRLLHTVTQYVAPVLNDLLATVAPATPANQDHGSSGTR